MKEYAIFPTLVTEHEYGDHSLYKQSFIESAYDYFDDQGRSSELTGAVDIHCDSRYNNLFTFLSSCVRAHMDTLGIDNDLYNINFVKSWLNVLQKATTPLHSHNDAHFSLVYYLHTPEEYNQNIRFHLTKNLNDPYGGAITVSNTKNVWNVYNSYNWFLNSIEGNAFVFPGHMPHDTFGSYHDNFDPGIKSKDDLMQRRISLACDVIITFNKKTAKPIGLQPIDQWRTFE